VLAVKFRWDPEQLQEDEAYLRRISKMVTPTEPVVAVSADPDDDKILACALAAQADAVVTGDHHLLDLGEYRGISVMRVADFLRRAAGQQR
jgi:putative PIN family toxin of toxin-antitoxin system